MNVKKVRNEQRKIILKVKERFENKSYSKDNNSDLYFLMDALYNVTKLELGLQGCEAYTTSLPNQRIRYNIKSLFDFILNSPKMLNSGEQEKQVNKSKHVEKKGKSQIRIKFVNSDETKNRMTVNFWRPVMRNGVIEFLRPEECPIHKPEHEMPIKEFGRLVNFSGIEEFSGGGV